MMSRATQTHLAGHQVVEGKTLCKIGIFSLRGKVKSTNIHRV